MSTFQKIQEAFDNATTVQEYQEAKRLLRRLSTAECFAMIDAAIDSRVRIERQYKTRIGRATDRAIVRAGRGL